MYSDLSFEQRLGRINLDAVMAHVAEDTGLEGADLVRAEDLYRKFLTLRHLHAGKTIVPPRLVDAVWHAHITFTRQYMADCEMLFGEYLHHEPGLVDAADLFEGTVELYRSEFGVELLSYGINAAWFEASPCAGS